MPVLRWHLELPADSAFLLDLDHDSILLFRSTWLPELHFRFFQFPRVDQVDLAHLGRLDPPGLDHRLNPADSYPQAVGRLGGCQKIHLAFILSDKTETAALMVSITF